TLRPTARMEGSSGSRRAIRDELELADELHGYAGYCCIGELDGIPVRKAHAAVRSLAPDIVGVRRTVDAVPFLAEIDPDPPDRIVCSWRNGHRRLELDPWEIQLLGIIPVGRFLCDPADLVSSRWRWRLCTTDGRRVIGAHFAILIQGPHRLIRLMDLNSGSFKVRFGFVANLGHEYGVACLRERFARVQRLQQVGVQVEFLSQKFLGP